MVVRNSYWRMMKSGRFRALRNLPVGWVLQILHSTDRTERWVRIAFEAVLILMFWLGLSDIHLLHDDSIRFGWVFFIVHSVSWFFIGNFWVYMLDSFMWVKNPGLDAVLKYVEFVRRAFVASGSCDAVLIYGSMCRSAFHGRSDLDLRIVRKPGFALGLISVFVGFYVRIPAALRIIPVDLQVVDSLDFLAKQMRPDENPIVVYLRPGFELKNSGDAFETILKNPSQVLRDKAAQKPTACRSSS